jgi:alpha-glucoside transport system substrate-binding protein
VYQPLEQSFLEILEAAEIARFDGSDLMPADVGAGTFWSEGTSLVNGDTTAADAAAAIEASWPS